MRNRFHDEPVGDPFRGAPYGEKLDPNSIGAGAGGAAASTGGGMAGSLGAMGTIMQFVGNMSAGSAAKGAGQSQKAAADFEAAQMEQSAGQSVAASQRKAIDERRRTALVVSRGLAVAAASGGGASDPTVMKLLSDVEGEGAYRAGVALYQGEEQARQLNMGAKAKRFEGDIAAEGGSSRQRAYEFAGIGSLVARGSSLFGRYGMGGPKPTGNQWLDAGTPDFTAFG